MSSRSCRYCSRSRLVRRSLERALYQGWDLHAHQLPTRFLTNYAFYRRSLGTSAHRLQVYRSRSVPGIEAADVAEGPRDTGPELDRFRDAFPAAQPAASAG